MSLSTNYRDLSAIVSSAAPLQNSGYWGRRQVAKNGLIEVFRCLVEICPPLMARLQSAPDFRCILYTCPYLSLPQYVAVSSRPPWPGCSQHQTSAASSTNKHFSETAGICYSIEGKSSLEGWRKQLCPSLRPYPGALFRFPVQDVPSQSFLQCLFLSDPRQDPIEQNTPYFFAFLQYSYIFARNFSRNEIPGKVVIFVRKY